MQLMNKNRVFPISMAVLWSIVFANAMHSWTIGICLGITMGIAFGLFDSGDGGEDDEVQ